jgi:hypothetical protein
MNHFAAVLALMFNVPSLLTVTDLFPIVRLAAETRHRQVLCHSDDLATHVERMHSTKSRCQR